MVNAKSAGQLGLQCFDHWSKVWPVAWYLVAFPHLKTSVSYLTLSLLSGGGDSPLSAASVKGKGQYNAYYYCYSHEPDKETGWQ